MSTPEKVGIIGSGAFGNVTAGYLVPRHAEVTVFDVDPHAKIPRHADRASSVDDVLESDLLFLAIPIQEYPIVLPKIAEGSPTTTTVIDQASVKCFAFEQFQENGLTSRPYALTHSLWGPKALSERKSVKNRNMVVSEYREGRFESVDRLFEYWRTKKKINLIEETAETHDWDMREHALAFFIGETLVEMGGYIGDKPATPFIKKLHTIRNEMKDHSAGLFDTIEEYNPFAADIRLRFLLAAMRIHEGIEINPDIISANNNPFDQLADLRTLIDLTDDTFAALVGSRYNLTDAVSLVKSKGGIDMYDRAREDSILAKAISYGDEYDINPDIFERYFRDVMSDVVKRNLVQEHQQPLPLDEFEDTTDLQEA